MSRQTEYTEEIGLAICERIADGESLRQICADDNMPARSTVFKWLSENDKFSDQYARAREEQADTLADEIVGISDEECTMIRADKHPAVKGEDEEGNLEVVFDSVAVARNKLRVDARKWVASKLKPKKYGDKVDVGIGNTDDKPLQIDDGTKAAKLAAIMAAAQARKQAGE
jgi:hypothetical protein